MAPVRVNRPVRTSPSTETQDAAAPKKRARCQIPEEETYLSSSHLDLHWGTA